MSVSKIEPADNTDDKFIPDSFDYENVVDVLDTTYRLELDSMKVDVLVVAGGGGGGGRHGGGGGAGGLRYFTEEPVSGNVSIVVGDGGAGKIGTVGGAEAGDDGGNSSFGSRSATGGGGGGKGVEPRDGRSGGSGGGNAGNNTSASGNAGDYEPAEGKDGGKGYASSPAFLGGGGGGHSQVGGDASTTVAGSGGDGSQYNISGENKYYAGGGGGGRWTSQTAGSGGNGGGGDGGVNGTANTGGGGGGGIEEETSGSGGSGIVILRYKTDGSDGIASATGGTKTTSGDYTIHVFTADGTFSPTAINGYRVSNPLSLDSIKKVKSSNIKWTSTLPDARTDLVSYYKLEENAANTTVADAHGSNTGTANKNTSGLSATGKIDNAFNLDGTNDNISFSSSLVDFSGNFTIQLWKNKADKGATADNDRIISLITDANNGFQLITDDVTGKYAVLLKRAGTNTINQLTYGARIDDEWVHIAYVVSGTTGTMYINGSAVSSDGSAAIGFGGTGYHIGKRADDQNTTFFKGKIDEVGCWDRALSADEITALYNSGNGLAYPLPLTDIKIYTAISDSNTVEPSFNKEVDYDDASSNNLSTNWDTLIGSFSHSTDHYISAVPSTNATNPTIASKTKGSEIVGLKADVANVRASGNGRSVQIAFGEGDATSWIASPDTAARIVSDGYQLFITENGDSLSLARIIDGSRTGLGTKSVTIDGNTFYTFELYRDGDDIVVTMDGTEQIRVADTNYYSSADTTIRFAGERAVDNRSQIKVKNIFIKENEYDEEVSDTSIDSISTDQDLTGKYLWVRQELSTEDTDETPRLTSLEYEVVGEDATANFFLFF